MPGVLQDLWRIFERLRARKFNQLGLMAIEWTDLDAFTRLTGIRLSPFEIELVEMLDALWIAEKVKASQPSGEP